MRCPHSCVKPLRLKAERAFSLIENLVAIAIVVLFFGALYAINSQNLFLLNAGRGAAIAGKCLQDRAEQLRNCKWSQLTDANYLQNNVLNTSPLGVANLGLVTETVTIKAYPLASPSPATISVVRANGSANITSTNNSMVNQDMVRVDSSLTWTTGVGGRTRTQSASTLIAKNIP